jgi:CheY-like chemotaxis protein
MTKEHYVIVVADDNILINNLLGELLSYEGYEVLHCFSGEEAQQVIRRVTPDIAILDMQMETEDAGLRVLEHLRQHPETAHVSALICSADAYFLKSKEQDILRYGGTLVHKPFNIPYLLETIEQLLSKAP